MTDREQPTIPPVDAPLEDILALPPRAFDEWLTQEGARARLDAERRPPELNVPEDAEAFASFVEDLVERGDLRHVLDARALMERASAPRVPPRVRAEVRRLVDAANQLPDERSEALRARATRLLAGLEVTLENLEPFGRAVATKTYIRPSPDGRLEAVRRETDPRGRVREAVLGSVDPGMYAPGARPPAPAAEEPEVLREIAPADVRRWSADRWLKFRQKYPEAADQLLRGQTVTDRSGFQF
ncbi:MAG TPA: hypothetical protein VNO79_10365 [Actinomycetota bacterium]|nr:hypothetical protein [Actinomycetota bacterium]